MLWSTSLMVYVGAGEQPALTPRKLTLLNTTSQSVIQDVSLPTSVLAVRLNRQRWDCRQPASAGSGATACCRNQHVARQ